MFGVADVLRRREVSKRQQSHISRQQGIKTNRRFLTNAELFGRTKKYLLFQEACFVEALDSWFCIETKLLAKQI